MVLTDTVTIPSHVLAQRLGEETVILDLASGTYFGLEEIGTRIWEALGAGNSLAKVCDILADEFAVPRTELERDSLLLAEELLARGLISVV